MRTIFLNEVLAEVNKVNAMFSIGFFKDSGDYVVKERVTNRFKPNLAERKKMNRNGLLNCYIASSDEFFDCTIDLVMNFNEMEVIRPVA